MGKLLVLHCSYGCDSGCCGHRVEVEEGDARRFSFEFAHAADETDEEKRLFAAKMVGEENLADVDFEHSDIASYDVC